MDYQYDLTLVPLKHEYKPSTALRHRELDVSKGNGNYYPYIPRDGKNMGDFWDEDLVRTAVVSNHAKDSTSEHPAPFPEDIVTLPILQTTNPNDLVCDPFMGTGTTGRVANRLGRRFVGYDIREY